MNLKAVSLTLSLICLPLLPACGDPSDEAAPLAGTAEQALCNDPDGCVVDPTGGPPKPAVPVLRARSVSSLTVDFKVQTGWTSWTLQRRAPGGSWATAAAGNSPTTATRTFEDGGRPADSRWCYRLKGTSAQGSGYSAERCGLTAMVSPVNPPLATVTLRVKVANVADAGTNGSIGVRLSSLSLPGYNFTGLNRAIDDFERNSYQEYILLPYNLASVRDISELTLTNYGSDGVCIESLQLIANDATIFSRTFGVATCRWIDGDAPSSPTLTIPFEELRADPVFMNFVRPPLLNGMPVAKLAALVEAIVGNAIWAQAEVDWGQISGAAVEIKRTGDDTLHVDLDLEGIANNAPNPEIDVDFDLRLGFVPSGADWKLNIEILNFQSAVDFSWWTEVLGSVCVLRGAGPGQAANCVTLIEDYIEEQIAKALAGQLHAPPILVTAAQLQQLGCSTSTRPVVDINADGSLVFACR